MKTDRSSRARLMTVLGAALAAAVLWVSPVSAREAAPAADHPVAAEGTHAPVHGGAAVETAAQTPAHASDAVGVDGHDAHEAHGEHGGHGEHKKSAVPHLPNVIALLLKIPVEEGRSLGDTPLGHFIHTWEIHIFLVIVTILGIGILWLASKMRALMPTRGQVFFEMIHEGFYNFFGGILGEKNLKYVPFLGSLFLFIYIQNAVGLIPLMTGGTGSYVTTATLAVMVFFYVQLNAIKAAGFGHWALHFLGSPKDTFGWIIGFFLLPLEIIGALAKPLSLSLRLFGNMMGEHVLVGVFLIMGVNMVLHFVPQSPIGIPLHLPFLFLGLLTTFIQALVFALLSTIYLVLLLPHDDHHADEMHDMTHDEKHGMRDDHHQHVTAGDISPV